MSGVGFGVLAGVLAAGLLGGCVLPAGYGGLVYIPGGSVSLPREESLDACAAAVRSGVTATNPRALGAFQPSLAAAPANGPGILGVCTGPDGMMSLVTATEIRPGPRILIER